MKPSGRHINRVASARGIRCEQPELALPLLAAALLSYLLHPERRHATANGTAGLRNLLSL